MSLSSSDQAEQRLAEMQAELEATQTQLVAAQNTIAGLSQETAGGPLEPGESFRDCDFCPEMVVIPAGTFTMGSPADEEGRDDDEGPQRDVTIGSPFAIGKYEVTFEEYDRFAEATERDLPDDEGWGRGRRPVINVNWEDANTYCAWLGEQTVRTYRLPSEAEWEYAARAGTTTPFSTGDTITTEQANYDGNYPYAGDEKGEYRKKTLPVGSLEANPFGLADMHGNVWEWVEDIYQGSYEGAPADGSAWLKDGSLRVVRGGSWFYGAGLVRSAFRYGYEPGFPKGRCPFGHGFSRFFRHRLQRSGQRYRHTPPSRSLIPETPSRPGRTRQVEAVRPTN